MKQEIITFVNIMIALHYTIATGAVVLLFMCKEYAVALYKSITIIFVLVVSSVLLVYFMYVSRTNSYNDAEGICVIALVLGVIFFAFEAYGFIHIRNKRYEVINMSSIKAAVDDLNDGLCYSAGDGTVVLANRKMIQLAAELTGEYLRNTEHLWNEVCSFESNKNVVRLDFTETPTFIFGDGSVYSFSHSMVTDEHKEYIEILAHDVTALYYRSRELADSNEKLSQMQERLSDTLKNIAQIKQEEEILASKMRIHDRLGNTILYTRQALSAENVHDERAGILESWDKILTGLKENLLADNKDEEALELSVRRIAEALNCKIEVSGSLPKKNDTIEYAMREALYNAIRHAHADTLFVEAVNEDKYYCIKMWDNGIIEASKIVESGGLKSLRHFVESAGGSLKIRCYKGVEIYLKLPEEEIVYD